METNTNPAVRLVRLRGSAAPGIPLISPISREGLTPVFVGARPALGAEGQATKMAVGSIRSFLVYQYHFDSRRQDGGWHYIYSVYDGELV